MTSGLTFNPGKLQEPKAECLKRSFLILKYAGDSTTSLSQTFKQVREGKGPGATSDEEQDLLRSMVVFASAGLDSLLKQIVRDALPELLDKSGSAQTELLKFAQRALRGAGGKEEEPQEWSETDYKFLANVLLAKSPRDAVIENLINNLIGESLQSTNQIFKVIRCLGLDEKKLRLSTDKQKLDKIFNCRNQIIHEMDIDFSQPRRNRFTRKQAEMEGYANTMLRLSEEILKNVDEQLKS